MESGNVCVLFIVCYVYAIHSFDITVKGLLCIWLNRAFAYTAVTAVFLCTIFHRFLCLRSSLAAFLVSLSLT